MVVSVVIVERLLTKKVFQRPRLGEYAVKAEAADDAIRAMDWLAVCDDAKA